MRSEESQSLLFSRLDRPRSPASPCRASAPATIILVALQWAHSYQSLSYARGPELDTVFQAWSNKYRETSLSSICCLHCTRCLYSYLHNPASVCVFSLVRITKLNYHFVTWSLSTVRSLCTLSVKFSFSKMILSVNIVISVSARFSRLFPNTAMHYASRTMTV